MAAGDGSKKNSVAGTVLRHPLKVLSAVNMNNIKMFMSVAHYSGFKAAVQTTRHVLSNYMADRQRAENRECYTSKIGDVPNHMALPTFGIIDVSIIIPVYNQCSFTLSCIESIIYNTSEVSYEVILGDDSSTDDTRDIGSRVANLKIVKTDVNQGFLRNCNNASKYARGKYLLFLNNDTIVGKNWLKPMVDTMESSSDVGVVGSKLVYADGALQEAGCIMWSDGTSRNYGKGENPNRPEFNYLKEVDYVSGASLLIRKELFEQLGGFDDRYAPAYCEDSDLCMAVRHLGYRVMYQPRSEVVHFEGMTHGRPANTALNPYQEANIVKFREKWADQLRMQHCLPGRDIFHARDRSVERKAILVVTTRLPSGEYHSGSRMIFRYLQILTELGYNVKLAIGDNHYDLNHAIPLEDLGVEIYSGVEYRDGWKQLLHDHKKDFDHVVIMGYTIANRSMEYVAKHFRAKIHYYMRNNPLLGLEREYGLTNDSHTLLSLATVKRRNPVLMNLADDCITVSNADTEYAQSNSSVKTHQVPFIGYPSPDSVRNPKGCSVMFSGYLGHRPNADAVEYFIKSIMPVLRVQCPGITFHIYGDAADDDLRSLSCDDVIFEGPSDAESMEEAFLSCSAYVAPYRISSGIVGSVLDAMYFGVPVVSTSNGLEGIDSSVFYTFDEPQDFANEIVRIISDPSYARSRADVECKYITDNYSETSLKTALNNIFG